MKKQPVRELDRGGATKSTYLLSMDLEFEEVVLRLWSLHEARATARKSDPCCLILKTNKDANARASIVSRRGKGHIGRWLPRLSDLFFSFEAPDLVEDILVQLKGVRVASSLGTRVIQGEIRVVGSILSATHMNALDHQFSVLGPDQDW